MTQKTLCFILYALCLLYILSACQPVITQLRAPLEEEGEVFFYLQPFPQEAERLRFRLEGISVLDASGREFPISLLFDELKSAGARRQRLLGSSRLRPGTYSGLSIRVKSAVLKVEDGEAALRVPDESLRINFPFTIGRKKALVITLHFKYKESIQDGFFFNPLFSLSVPARPIISLAGYVTNSGSNNITVFDKRAGQVVGKIATGRGPAGMALDQNLRKVYAALSGDDAIEVIDISSAEVVNRLRLNTGDQPRELALTPDGKMLLAVNSGSNTVSIIDPVSLLELGRIDVGKGPNSILIDNTGRRAFVFNTLSSALSIIHIPNRAIAATISTDPAPLRGQFNRRGDRLYVIHEWSSYLTVIDPLSLLALRRHSVRMGMNAIKVDQKTDFVYLGRKNDVIIEVHDPFSFVPVDSIQTRGAIAYMTIDEEENNLYMVHPEERSLTATNLVSRKKVFEVDVGEGPYWVTVMGER